MPSNKHASQTHHNTYYGVAFMILNAFVISLIYTVIKKTTQDLSSHLVLFLYKLAILISIIPWCLWKGGISNLKTKRFFLHASRGFLSISGALCLFYAIKYINLTDVTAIGYLEQVLLVIIGIAYFKEDVTKAKITAIVLSFFGALVIVYANAIEFSPQHPIPTLHLEKINSEVNHYYFFVFMSIIFWAANCTVIKVLGKTEKTKIQLFYNLLVSCTIAFPLAFMDWETVTSVGPIAIKFPIRWFALEELGLKFEHIKYLAIAAMAYFIHSVAFINALKHAEMSVVMPFYYTNLVFTGILAYIYFHETPTDSKYLGYSLIVFAGIVLIKSEAKRQKKLKQRQIEELEQQYENA